jgi:pectate lyase-like protein
MKQNHLIVIAILLLPAQTFGQEVDYLAVVRGYADAMLEHGRDTYGAQESPAFIAAMDRHTLAMLDGDALERVLSIPREEWGIRPHDRALFGANPMHDQNLYQVLYALSAVTGEPRYATEADAALRWFFERCQSPATNLFCWGEHLSWDFRNEARYSYSSDVGTHEFYRPWVLWERSFALAPEPCAGYARGLWEHQIGDHATGNYSRHSAYERHGPGTNSEYPRHGGFYIATWSQAYRQTQDPIYLKAIETVVDYFESRRSPASGALPCESNKRSMGKRIWPESNLSLAIDLWDGAQHVPDALAGKMRETARKADKTFLLMAHDLTQGGPGFVKTAHVDTLVAEGAYTRTWATGYGDATDAQIANLSLLRHGQVGIAPYRHLVMGAAARYLDSEPDTAIPLYPGAVGDAIELMLGVHDLTGEQRYLDRADHFARQAIDIFFTDSPLPKASSQHDHYEAITRGDTLAMELLKLWAVKVGQADEIRLTWNER